MQNKNKATMKDIAEKANVSLTTVSFVLNDSGRVSSETKDKVIKISRKLNYTPNLAAREIAGKSSSVIGIILPDFNDPKLGELLEGIDNISTKENFYNMICFSHNKLEKEKNYLELLVGKNVDGLIIFPFAFGEKSNIQNFKQIKQKDIPLVFVDINLDKINCSYIATDNYSAAFKGTKYLLNHRNEKIAFIGGNYNYVCRERIRGYVDAMKKAGIYDNSLLYSDVSHTEGLREIKQRIIKNNILNENITGIIAYNKSTTQAVLELINESNNNNIEVIGFDYFQGEQFSDIPIYTFRQPHYKMGQKAVEIVVKKIQGKDIGNTNVLLTASFEPITKKAKEILSLNTF